MMPSDDIIIKATTLTSNVQALIPQIWASRIEKNLRKHAVLQQSLVVFNDLLAPGAGDTIYVPILPDLAAAVALTEGTDMTPIALNNASSIALVPSEYGVTVEITRKALDRMKYDGVAEIMDRLTYAMTLLIEGQIAALWNKAVPGTSNKLTQVYANNKTSANITTADTFNEVMLLNAIETMEAANNVPFEDGQFVAYINPAQWASLLQDQNVRNILQWSGAGQASNRLTNGTVGMLNGERGSLHGVRIVVTNYIAQNTENTVAVNKGLMVAPRWAAAAYKRTPQVVVDPTLYDMGRRRRFGVLADLDIELIHNERAVVLASA